MKREAIYQALIDQLAPLKGAPYNVQVLSRDWLAWDNCPRQPAVFVVPEEELAAYDSAKIFIRWTIRVAVWVYVKKGSDTTLGVQVLTVILDGIEAILMPSAGRAMGPPPFVNSLGGLVSQLAINGPTVISPGYLGEQTVARVPIEIITAN